MSTIACERKHKLKLNWDTLTTSRKTKGKESQHDVSVECGAIRAHRSCWWGCNLAQQLWEAVSPYPVRPQMNLWPSIPAAGQRVSALSAAAHQETRARTFTQLLPHYAKPETTRRQQQSARHTGMSPGYCYSHTMANTWKQNRSCSCMQQPGWISDITLKKKAARHTATHTV